MKELEPAAVCRSLHIPTDSLMYKAVFQLNEIMGLMIKSAHISMIASAVRAAVCTFARIDSLLGETSQAASDALSLEQIGSKCITSRGWVSDLFVFWLRPEMETFSTMSLKLPSSMPFLSSCTTEPNIGHFLLCSIPFHKLLSNV